MKYIPYAIIILMLSYLIGLNLGMMRAIPRTNDTLRDMIYRLDLEKDQCLRREADLQDIVDNMADECYFK